MTDRTTLAASLLLVGAAVYYYQQKAQSDGNETTSSEATNSNSEIWASLNALFTVDQAGRMINVDTENTNMIENSINAVRNLFTGNDIREVIETGVGYLKVRRPDGSIVVLRGSRNWRNNNPGNIEYGNYAVAMGALATDGRFAVFPNYAMGRRAKERLIFEGTSYKNISLADAIARYAPPGENNTSWYQKTVLAAVNGVNKLMSAYSTDERNKILAAMEKVEGYKPGTVTQVG